MSANDEPRTVTAGDERGGASPRRVPCLHLLLASHRPLDPLLRIALGGLDEVEIGRAAQTGWSRPEAGRLSLKLADPRLSSQHARLVFALGRWAIVDAGSKNGTLVNGARAAKTPLSDGDLLELGQCFFTFREHEGGPALASPVAEIDGAAEAPGLATTLPGLSASLERLALIARSPVTVMIAGETGTGKELAARAVHSLSGRRGAMVAVNCGAIAPNLVEGELFGHKKGAFSGALEDRPGLVRSADQGTLFLDEIGDLPSTAQAALLRVLQEGEVLPIGAVKPLPVDLRVVAATHRPLEQMVAAGDFRADLYGRLSGHRIALLPLRARREDFGLLVAALLRRLAGERAETITLQPRAAKALLTHDWPGNIRELSQLLGAALVLATDGVITLDHLPEAFGRSGGVPAPAPPAPAPAPTAGAPSFRPLLDEVEALERQRMSEALAASGGNQTRAAALIGMPLRTFQTKHKQYGFGGKAR